MKLLGKILYTVATAALILLLVLHFLSLAVQIAGGKDRPELLGWSQAIVLSGSMEPEFSAGDMIVIHREHDYQKGDIITYAENGAAVTHRIVESTAEGYITQGDANNVPDQNPVAREQVYGKVVFVIPGAGNMVLFFRSTGGIACLVVLAGLLIWGKDAAALVYKAGRKSSE